MLANNSSVSAEDVFPVVLTYFFIEILNRIIFVAGNNLNPIGTKQKFVRDAITLVVFLVYVFYKKILTKSDFKICFGRLFLAAAILFVFFKLFVRSEPYEINVYMVFKALIFAPIVEETICRKAILTGLRNSGHLVWGILLSTILFVSLHFDFSFEGLVYFTLLSSLLMALQLSTGKIINSMLLHSFINFMILFLL